MVKASRLILGMAPIEDREDTQVGTLGGRPSLSCEVGSTSRSGMRPSGASLDPAMRGVAAIRRQIQLRDFSAPTKAAMARLLKGETYRAAAAAEGIDHRHLARRAATVPWLRDAHLEARPEPAGRAGTWPAGFRARRRAERTEPVSMRLDPWTWRMLKAVANHYEVPPRTLAAAILQEWTVRACPRRLSQRVPPNRFRDPVAGDGEQFDQGPGAIA